MHESVYQTIIEWDEGGGKRSRRELTRRIVALYTAQQTAVPLTARPLDDWHEDDGPVLWWQFPIEEPPYVGSPLSDTWPGYHTHWTPIFVPTEHGITPKESSDD